MWVRLPWESLLDDNRGKAGTAEEELKVEVVFYHR